jgi:HlyD family secretion protein
MRYLSWQSRSRGRGPGAGGVSPLRGLRHAPLVAMGVALLCLTAGCHRPPAANQPEGPTTSEVKVTKPERKTVRYAIVQPGYNIEAYQQTPLYAKVAGFVEKVRVDIGDVVKGPKYDPSGKLVREGDVLAELWVPEMEVELREKEAAVRQAEAEVLQAKKALGAAESNLRSSEARIRQAEAARLRARADYSHTQSQYQRLARAGQGGVIARENVSETEFLFEAAKAGLAEAEANIESAKALRDESEARRDKAKADVTVAEAHLEKARAVRDNARTLLGYTKIRAPFDGVVTRRDVNVGHFVQPAAGTAEKGRALFNVDQTDVVRVFVNVPELDAVWVYDRAPAHVRVQGLKGQTFQGTVTRTSYAYDPRARTLRTEIDLPSAGGKLRPGMYVRATIVVEHKNAWALPASAVVTEGEQSYCYRVENGKAVRTPLRVGISGEGLVEILKKRTKPAKPGEGGVWEDLRGDEEIIEGNVAGLKDGQAVQATS